MSKVERNRLIRIAESQRSAVRLAHSESTVLLCADGLDDSTVSRIRKSNGLKPHLSEGFMVSRDPKFVEKLEDIVGRDLVCCLKANDGALNGSVISRCEQRHRHGEWLAFLQQVDRETSNKKTRHLICDNYATHTHPVVTAWLAKHPRVRMHFTPTSGAKLNTVERFFRDITPARLRNEAFLRVPELTQAGEEYIAHHNTNPSPSSRRHKPKTSSKKSSAPTDA